MKCPVCENVNLSMTERQGVEIDYCPQCRGVWLDRGELDKIIERSATTSVTSADVHANTPVPRPPSPPVQPVSSPQHYPQHQQQHHHHQSYQNHGGHYKKKKEGFLSELFDFD